MYLSPKVIVKWPLPNYDHPVTRGSSVIIVHLILYFLVLIVVGLRIYTRLRVSRSFGSDDVFILLAMFPTTAFAAVTFIAESRYGWDRHAWDVPLSMVSMGLQLSLASQILFAAAATCTRLSMLFLTRRILCAGYKKLQRIVTFAIILIPSACVIFIIVVIFQCRPISGIWTLSFKPQQCINEQIHLLLQGVLNIIADFAVVLIPIPVVLKLNLPLRQRIIVALLFGASFIVCFAGIARTIYMYRVNDGNDDMTWNAFPVWLATAIELYIGIICTSAPPTKPFFARYMPKLLSSTSNTTQTGDHSGWAASFTRSQNIVLKYSNRGVANDSNSNNSPPCTSLSTPPHTARRVTDFIQKKIEISQSTSEISQLRSPFTSTSIEHLVK